MNESVSKTVKHFLMEAKGKTSEVAYTTPEGEVYVQKIVNNPEGKGSQKYGMDRLWSTTLAGYWGAIHKSHGMYSWFIDARFGEKKPGGWLTRHYNRRAAEGENRNFQDALNALEDKLADIVKEQFDIDYKRWGMAARR